MKDKIHIWGSPLGMIMTPRMDFMFASADMDGTWNWEKINNFLWNIANRGANGFRDFGPWIDGPGMENISPWKYNKENKKYDLSKFNQQYFDNLRNLARLAKMYNLNFCIDVLNSSETRVKNEETNPKDWTPWKRNIQNLKNYFYDNDAFPFIKLFIKKLIETFKELDNIFYQACNEPALKGSEYLAFTYITLVKNKIPLNRIFTGMDPLRKNTESAYQKFYMNFRKIVAGELGKEFESYIKEKSWSGLHKASRENIKIYFEKGLKEDEKVPSMAGRCISYSDDGLKDQNSLRPTYTKAYMSTMYLLKTKKGAYLKNKLGRETIAGKRKSECNGKPYEGLEGTVAAIVDFSEKILKKKKYLENFNRFKKPFDLPDWIIGKKEPEPKEPEPKEPEPKEPEPEEPIKEEKVNFIKKNWKYIGIFTLIPVIFTFTWSNLWVIPAALLSHILWYIGIIKK